MSEELKKKNITIDVPDNDSIDELSDKESIRERTGNTLGSDTEEGAFHCVIEIVDNSVDEKKAGRGDKIIFTLHKDGSYSVEDFAGGVPMGWSEKKNKYNYELVFMTLYAGGKFKDKNGTGYERAKGLNGLGATATAYSSEDFYARSHRDGIKYELKMHEGDVVSYTETPFEYESTGTYIKWKPSKEVFTETNIPHQWIYDYLEEQAIVNSMTFEIINEIDETEIVYSYENGIKDYAVKLSEGKEFTTLQYYESSATGKDVEHRKAYSSEYEVAFFFNNENAQIRSYHNSSYLKYGGSPHEAVKLAFTYSIDKLIKKNNKYNKGEKKVTFDDIKDSLLIVTSTYSTETSYENQTKFAIRNKFIQEHLNELLREKLEIYFIENPLETDKIIEQVLINKRSREKAEKTRLDIKKKLQVNSGIGLKNKIDDLNDCDMDNTTLEERELWVCEGESACQTMTNSRDDRTMGTYPLRGRFISSLKNSVEDVLNNRPAMGIIQSLGCGIEIPSEERKSFKNISTFNKENLRYGNIVIACDSDSFGNGISIALVTFFYKFIPTLLKENRIHISLSPRYKITVKNKELFAYDENEKNEMIKELDSQNTKYNVGIIKGLGELNGDTYWNYVMNPETRKIKKLIYKSEFDEQLEHYFNILMGEDIEGRKKYIEENITNLDLTLVD